ncbi:hypothetical protein ACH4CE_22645 [Streptomyces gelaticus]|uniref:hypothetical protein n=1 Tax=Streptomyces gelaticus TaxID=285446 RepID=UPI0037A1E07A
MRVACTGSAAEGGQLVAPLRAIGPALADSFGGGDRTEGFHDARTQQRLAGLVSRHDPASLFGGSYGISPGGR